jgi:trehalose 6-phosphate synthase/phosphatase
MAKRLFIISNRLPVTITNVDNEIVVKISDGGLVTAISSYINYASEKGNNDFSENIWIGVPGCGQNEWVEAKSKMDESEYKFLPVFINHHIYDLYYNGFSNSVIWPLFHYFPSYADYKVEYFEKYLKSNEDFLSVIIRSVREEDVLWIHDYHLLPLAGLIRNHYPNITIGFFLHIPFPSYELFRLMPCTWQKEILSGLLGADLIGFHTIDYASHFLKSLQMVLGVEAELNTVKYKNRLVKVDVFPISIDFGKFNSAFNLKEVGMLRHQYKNQFEGKKILFSVDRLDYTKGVFSRLKAYEYFLQSFPEYLERVVFIIIVVPSRSSIKKYTARKREIDEFIGNLNSSVGTIHWKPVVYQYTHLDFSQLLALYTACDLAVITPLRDGMNLVAKEFVSSRSDEKGVLLLSEMAGAARELTDALLVNPNDIVDFAIKIKQGLEMDVTEQEERLIPMQNRIREYDVVTWADDFFKQLDRIKVKQREFEFAFLSRDAKMLIYDKYRASGKRLLILDYDGTLVTFSSSPHKSHPEPSLLNLLNNLSATERNDVYVISGRDSETLEKWFGHLPLNLVAEQGAKIKLSNANWKITENVNQNQDWKKIIRGVMESYVKRCVNTFIEEREFALVWHFRSAQAEQGKIRANELVTELTPMAYHLDLQVMTGHKIIEVRIKGISKDRVLSGLLKERTYDFILACGDDSTDEDMFKVLADKPEAFTIKIGDEASYAKYNLYTPQMLISLLTNFENFYL